MLDVGHEGMKGRQIRKENRNKFSALSDFEFFILIFWPHRYFQKQDLVEAVVFVDDSVLVFYPNKIQTELGTFCHCIYTKRCGKGEWRKEGRKRLPHLLNINK